MRTLPKIEAVAKLTHQIAGMRPDDLAAVFEELFPSESISEKEVGTREEEILGRISDHIGRGLETEELVDLWNVVFPESRKVTYDEDTLSIRYQDTSPGCAD
jgi:hypothetical protein